MANISVLYPTYAPVDKLFDGDVPTTYKSGDTLGKAMQISISPSYLRTSELNGSRLIFQNAKISAQVTELSPTNEADLFGAVEDCDTVLYKITAPETAVGFGFIRAELRGGKRRYVVEWLNKVYFDPPSESAVTKGRNVTITTPTLSGIAVSDGSPEWRVSTRFDTLSEALSFLKARAEIYE